MEPSCGSGSESGDAQHTEASSKALSFDAPEVQFAWEMPYQLVHRCCVDALADLAKARRCLQLVLARPRSTSWLVPAWPRSFNWYVLARRRSTSWLGVRSRSASWLGLRRPKRWRGLDLLVHGLLRFPLNRLSMHLVEDFDNFACFSQLPAIAPRGLVPTETHPGGGMCVVEPEDRRAGPNVFPSGVHADDVIGVELGAGAVSDGTTIELLRGWVGYKGWGEDLPGVEARAGSGPDGLPTGPRGQI